MWCDLIVDGCADWYVNECLNNTYLLVGIVFELSYT